MTNQNRFSIQYFLLMLLLPLLLCLSMCSSQKDKKNIVFISPNDPIEEIVKKAANVVPSPRQIAWQELELTAFACFSMNTFTDKEWGDGKEDPAIFNPTEFDARQWAKVCKDAGMKMIILTLRLIKNQSMCHKDLLQLV